MSGLPALRLASDEAECQPVVWVGTISFEERCLGSLRALANRGTPLRRALLIDYPTQAEPHRVDEAQRGRHRQEMIQLVQTLSAGEAPSVPEIIHPYRLSSFRKLLGNFDLLETTTENTQLIVDITCLTKAHILSLALWLTTVVSRGRSVRIAYTRPDQYGTPARHQAQGRGWPEIVLAPCVLCPQKYTEEANGLILLGYEGPRLLLALSQVIPEDALAILWRTERHEELEIVARIANSRLLGQIERGEKPTWRLEETSEERIEGVQAAVRSFVADSANNNRRIVLFPFGPKPLILAVALTALAAEPGRVWYCYPIPKVYDVDYSIGIGPTRWFEYGGDRET